ncbi:enoyl-CoA hydratase/carnithine racemase [Paraburkholderia sp. BL6665CI2N2]|uniref:enoyl-CoA hydratase/isomerase family protein n=1 Tax=Paraburkholderia sp. BL6665CI2N2 TaxID=1938806 RepID=UPI001066F600|nr:enoyl-CoA hydratase/isomerase family protein [Paraburkholderia sp. BL6665CI2N2]TDY23045.1 enoyl-CoA hydratase/carnithine racemase [Paraburkholderia sp. BL6665CI2N2]
MDEAIVQTEIKGHVTVLTMNRRPHNLMGPTLYRALLDEFDEAVKRGSRAILLRSNLRHFSAGAEVALFPDRIAKQGKALMDPLEVLRGFESLPIPIVVAVNGTCLGGGFEVALACDFSVVAESAKIGSVEVALGLHPLLGGIQRQVMRAGPARAKELALLGRRYDAATLERWGLINLVVPDDKLDEVALSVAQELAAGPTVAHAATKQLVRVAVNEGVAAADEAMFELQKPIWASQDLKRGLEAFDKAGPGTAVFEGN